MGFVEKNLGTKNFIGLWLTTIDNVIKIYGGKENFIDTYNIPEGDFDVKRYMFEEALIKFLEIFSESNYGSSEVDITAVIDYVESPKFAFRDSWNVKTLDDCYPIIENMALNGLPLWEFLKISDWSKNMLSKEFLSEVQKERDELRRQYKCYRGCQFFEEKNTGMGIIQRCTYDCGWRKKREVFSLKKTCRNFKKKDI